MKHSLRPRKTANLPESVHHQLNMYALAATAAGVGVLALAAPAEARIVYTRTHHVIAEGGHYRLDVNHDGITDFTLQAQITHTTGYSGFYASISAVPAAGNGVEGWTGGRAWASALKTGAVSVRNTISREKSWLRFVHPSVRVDPAGAGSTLINATWD